MKNVDFLSGAPKMFIFEKNSNKTSLGGVLTIIFLIVFFVLAFVYIYNYEMDNKYIVSYGSYQKPYDEKEVDDKNKDPNYNPTLSFIFDVTDFGENPLSDNYVLFDFYTGNIIERNKPIEFNISKLRIVVLYNCSNYNCYLKEEDYDSYYSSLSYYFYYSMNFYDYNFEDDDQPVKMDKTKFVVNRFTFSHDIGHVVNSFWRVTKVTEEQGFLDKLLSKEEKSSFGGDFYKEEVSAISPIIVNIEDDLFGVEKYNFDGIYKILYTFCAENQFTDYTEYKRKKISIFDIFADICSLSLTIYSAFQFFFMFFFSENFNNYKIVQRIISKTDISFKKITELKSFYYGNKEKENNIISKEKDMIEQVSEKENDKDLTERTIEVKNANNIQLPKFHFFHFICNIFSSICFKKSKEQRCINIFQEIIQKYNSIDSIVYNQLMMEILLKDYRWNHPNLLSIKNIELLDKLKCIINGEDYQKILNKEIFNYLK